MASQKITNKLSVTMEVKTSQTSAGTLINLHKKTGGTLHASLLPRCGLGLWWPRMALFVGDSNRVQISPESWLTAVRCATQVST